jgi:hypothetical protein
MRTSPLFSAAAGCVAGGYLATLRCDAVRNLMLIALELEDDVIRNATKLNQ